MYATRPVPASQATKRITPAKSTNFASWISIYPGPLGTTQITTPRLDARGRVESHPVVFMLSAADSRATASGAVPQQVLGTRVPIAMRPQVEPLLAVRKNFQSLVTPCLTNKNGTGDWNGRKLELYIAVPSLPS